MSGDFGPRVTLPATLRALENHPRLRISLVGDDQALAAALASAGTTAGCRARIEIVPAGGVLPMDAVPRDILRGEQDSSLHVAMQLLAESRVDGVVSAGNTAALLALGRRHISMLPGFSRPALCAAMPVRTGYRYMMDLGANVDCDADSLLEFAHLGTTLINVLENNPQPGVALLCNGSEANKGNLAIREAAKALERDPAINFAGYMEGHELHQPGAELVVCDGLVGNVALKTAEGTADLAGSLIRESFSRHWWLRLVSIAAAPTLRGLKESLSADRHAGAFLLGLRGVVVKSHGASTTEAFTTALDRAARCIENNMIDKLARHLDEQLASDT